MINQLEKIISHFNSNLIKREIDSNLSKKLTAENLKWFYIVILSKKLVF